MNTTLEPEGKKLLNYLITLMGKIDHSNLKGTFPTYKGVLDALRLDAFLGPTYGIALNRQGLDNLAYWIKDRDLPAITGLVIDKAEQKPGNGFFELYGKNTLDYAWWLEKRGRVKRFDWSTVVTSRV